MACRRESGFKDTKFWWIVGGFFLFLFKAQQPCHASLSAHVIPTLGSAAMSCRRWHVRERASMAAVLSPLSGNKERRG
jgi:hypothetical protein